MVETQALRAAELRQKWVEYLGASNGPLSCEDIRACLAAEDLVALGDCKKAQIRNIYGAAKNDPRIERVSPGRFALR
jgi:hypothetical protein